MGTILKAGFIGPYIMDFQNLTGVLVQVNDGALRGLRREKEGWPEVMGELLERVPTYADMLNVSADLATRIVTVSAQIDQVRALKVWAEDLAIAAKATEVLLEDKREGYVASVVKGVRQASTREDPTLEVLFGKTIRYYGQYAAQAAKTRAENQAAAEAESDADAEADDEAEAETDAEAEGEADDETAEPGPTSQAA